MAKQVIELDSLSEGDTEHALLNRKTEESVRLTLSGKLEPEIRTAPDGGWGWVVCFSCFMSHLLTDGIFYSFGMVFVELLDFFHASKGSTAFIPSLATGVCFLIGPIVGALVNRFGCRAVTVSGALITSGSFIISIFAPNIYFLYFSLGAMTGIGYGMVYFPTIVSVSLHFNKRRALATGLGVCGSGVGTFIFSPITKMLIDAYAWQGTILIQAGLVLNCVACGLVLRPVYYQADEIDINLQMREHSPQDNNDRLRLGPTDDLNTNCCAEKDSQMKESSFKETSEREDMNKNACPTNINNYMTTENIKTILVTDDSQALPKTQSDILVSDKMDACQNILESADHDIKGVSSVLTRIRQAFNTEIFRNRALIMFIISTFFYTLGYYVPYIYLPDRAKDAGMDDTRGAWLVSSVGITNTFGRVIFGFISDRKCVNRLYLYNTALVLCGVATALGPLFGSFEALLFYAILFGLFSGVTVSLSSVILADIVGIDRLVDAFGVTNFFAGIAAFIGPPVAGWLYDVTKSYDASFVVTGVVIAISGAMLFLVPCFKSTNKK